MLGDFTYENPTRLHFGENGLGFLKEELARYGKTVMLSYGGGFMQLKREDVIEILKRAL